MRKTTRLAASRAVFAAAVALCAVTTLAGRANSDSRDAGASPPPSAPTFNKDIAPIVFENCAACHHPGGSGPFSLLSYQDVRKHARQIALVTESRYMPPWLPEPGFAEFADERRLSDDQIEIIRRWVEQGAAEGAPADLPPAPKFSDGWQLGQPDLVVKMPQPYALPAEGADVFRNFVIPIPVTTTRYVKAVEILPGDKRLVHHANILLDRTQTSRRRDERDAEVGFGGMDVTIESETFEPDSHFLFWKPGTVPWSEPDGMAWRLDPGTDLVLNMHLQPSGKREVIQPSVGLYFTDEPPTTHPMLLQLENDGAIDIPAGKKDFVVTDELVLPTDVDVLGVYPHAHYLGKDLQGVATLPDGTTKWLVRITRWDLNWQAVYRYAKPIFLPKGTTITMRYRYDNSALNERNPSRPPRRVVAGDQSTDEMGHLWIQVLPRAREDVRVVLQEALMRRRLQKYPADFTANFNLGAALQSMGKPDEAVGYYQAALRVRPDDVTALNSLGTAFQELGKVEEAAGYYRRVVGLKPDYANARYNLGNSLLALGKPDEAVDHLREVVRLQPGDAKAYISLGGAFALQGNLSQAVAHYEQALRVDPENAEAHGNLGYVYAIGGDMAQAVAHYEQALRLNPKNADTHNELGVLFARQGNLAQAAAHFEDALRINPDHATARENLKRARAQLEKGKAAGP
jgi:tetratricopeptide (TPR) repeat protein/mono/diheme cytochrome c family protein